MTTIKVLAKYYAFSAEVPKNGPKEGHFDSPDIVEEEKFEIFFPSNGCETKKDYIDTIRESGGISAVEKSLYGKSGNELRIFKFHENRRVVLNTKEQFDELVRNVKGQAGDPRVHLKLIPQKTLWRIKPGGSLELQRASLTDNQPSKETMMKSLKIDSTVKELNGLLEQKDMVNTKSYRLGDDVYILCVCAKHIKMRKGRGAASLLRDFKYEHFDKKHGSASGSDSKIEKTRNRSEKVVLNEESEGASKPQPSQPKIQNFFKKNKPKETDSDSSDSEPESISLRDWVRKRAKSNKQKLIEQDSSESDNSLKKGTNCDDSDDIGGNVAEIMTGKVPRKLDELGDPKHASENPSSSPPKKKKRNTLESDSSGIDDPGS